VKRRHFLQSLMITVGMCTGSISHAQSFCVFDFSGTAGDAYALMQDFALASRGWGVDLQLKAYKEEQDAIKAFKAKECDAIALTDISARQFNRFVGTLNAVGAVPNYRVARSAYHLLTHPKLAANLSQDGYEVAGAVPMGLVYMFSRDRQYISSLPSLMNRTIGVLETDPLQARLINRIGAKAVPLSISKFNSLFNHGKMDVIPAPAMAYQPLELEKGLSEKGAVARFPLVLLSQTVILQQEKFPINYGTQAREWMLGQLPRVFKMIERVENAIPSKRWIDIPQQDQQGYQRLMREMRLNFVRDGTYDPKMATLLKRIRCQQEPALFDCAMRDE
jgi:hypothetical protein